MDTLSVKNTCSLSNTNNFVSSLFLNFSNEIWQGTTQLPADQEVYFRYFTCIALESNLEENNEGNRKDLITRRWETNILPRHIKTNGIYI